MQSLRRCGGCNQFTMLVCHVASSRHQGSRSARMVHTELSLRRLLLALSLFGIRLPKRCPNPAILTRLRLFTQTTSSLVTAPGTSTTQFAPRSLSSTFSLPLRITTSSLLLLQTRHIVCNSFRMTRFDHIRHERLFWLPPVKAAVPVMRG